MTDSLLQNDDGRLLRSQPVTADIIVSDTYLRAYLQVAEARGADAADLLARSGWQGRLNDGITQLDLPTFLTLVGFILDECDNAGFGIEVGLRISPTAFGMVGFAAMSSATVRDSLTVTCRYWHLLRTGLNMEVEFGDEYSTIRLIEQKETTERIRRLFTEVALVSAWRVMQMVLGNEGHAEIKLTEPRPQYVERYEDQLPAVHYEQERDEMRFSSSILSRALPTASPMGLHHALEQCQQMEAEMQSGGLPGLSRIRNLMRQAGNNFLTTEELATACGLDVRTLRQHLTDLGTSYRELLDEAKCAMAKDLLMNNAYAITVIADELGYQGGGNFSRAFRRWTGVSPAEYRLQMAGLGPAGDD